MTEELFSLYGIYLCVLHVCEALQHFGFIKLSLSFTHSNICLTLKNFKLALSYSTKSY